MTTAPAHKPKRFRLSFVGAMEDQPRLLRAYGRACGGEVALVMRPTEARALLVFVSRDGSQVWKKDAEEEGTDAPRYPTTAMDSKEAVSLVRKEQKSLPGPGPITLRGQWTGVLHCTEAGQPQVELWRKLATYGTLRVTSSPGEGWSWRFERSEKWFSEPGRDAEDGISTLAEAIQAGVLGAMRLVKEACSFRDTRRRAAHDPAYAQKYPLPEQKPSSDPTEKLKEPPPPKEKKPKAPRKAKTPPKPKEPARKKVKVRKPTPARSPTAQAAHAPEVDPAKDKALLDAFREAIAEAMGGGA